MAGPEPDKTRSGRFLLPLVSSLLAASGCTLQQYPQSSLSPHSDYAWDIQRLLEAQVIWVVIIFMGVLLATLFILVRFRARPGAPDPQHVHGHTGLEIAWTIAPAVILTLVAVPTVETIYKTQSTPPPGSLHVRVIGHQWWWEFQYPELGVVTGSELHVSIAGALYDNTPELLGQWLNNPPGRKPGSLMPNLGLTQDQVAALVAYLTSLK